MAAAKRELNPEGPTKGQMMAKVLERARAERIREARARVPSPTMENIAVEVGCSLKTVWNVLHGVTHAAP